VKESLDHLRNQITVSAVAVLTSVHEYSMKTLLAGIDSSWSMWRRYQWVRHAKTFWVPSSMYQKKAGPETVWSHLTYDTWRLFREEYFEIARNVSRTGTHYYPDSGTVFAAYNTLLMKPFLVLEVLYMRYEITVLRILADDGKIYSLFLGECSVQPRQHFEKVEL
jgi:hypothetical protein